MKKTKKLYGTKAKTWANLTYIVALVLRIRLAKKMMKYYKSKADKIEDKIYSKKYKKLVKRFKDSENAVKWNQFFLNECK